MAQQKVKQDESGPAEPAPRVSPDLLPPVEELFALAYTDSEREMLLEGLHANRGHYADLRAAVIPNDVPPAFVFDPRVPGTEAPQQSAVGTGPALSAGQGVRESLPANLEEVAFWPLTRLAALVRDRQVTSTALTQMYLARLKRYDPVLHCVITLMEDRALEQAQRADEEIAAGRYRGPLHGIPWGVKDLMSVKGVRTTWGAGPYQDQIGAVDAAVVERLDAAGAVLLAKLAVGELAWDDIWFGGQTRNPWNLEEGASGSSAGSASAVAAGLVGFAIGTETYGSIISPCTRCRVTGLRPTFGRISRYGTMALSWTMDKIGPIARSVEDCALIFAAIHGSDGRDLSVRDAPFSWPLSAEPMDLSKLRIGYLKAVFEEDYDMKDRDQAALDVLRSLGAELIPFSLPDLPIRATQILLEAEAAAAFEELTLTNRDDLLARQNQDAWPTTFRRSRLIPAVEYIQAQRLRSLLIQAVGKIMADLDGYIAPTFHGGNLLVTNLTGHPAVVVPNGVMPDGHPASFTFTGRLYDEATVLAVAKRYQDATDYHRLVPPLPGN